jgi:hypothetical protein
MNTEEKQEIFQFYINDLNSYLNISKLENCEKISYSPFLLRGILGGINSLCYKNPESSTKILETGIVSMLIPLFRLYLPFVFSTSQSFSQSFYSSHSPLFDKMCNPSGSVYKSTISPFSLSSQHFSIAVKGIFQNGFKLMNNIKTVEKSFLNDEILDLICDVIKEFLASCEVIPSNFKIESEIETEISILSNISDIFILFCASCVDDLEAGKIKTIEPIVSKYFSLLYRLFAYFNPSCIEPSMNNDDVSSKEELLCVLASCMCLLCCYDKNFSNYEKMSLFLMNNIYAIYI